MSDKELILSLKLQHSNLKKDLTEILELVKSSDKKPYNSIILLLEKFKFDLLNHLKLEDNEFYPLYFKKSQHNEEYAKKLILQMNQIAEVVINFLKKYEKLDAIINNKKLFKKELLEIINTLNIRIETEEDGIYELYLA